MVIMDLKPKVKLTVNWKRLIIFIEMRFWPKRLCRLESCCWQRHSRQIFAMESMFKSKITIILYNATSELFTFLTFR